MDQIINSLTGFAGIGFDVIPSLICLRRTNNIFRLPSDIKALIRLRQKDAQVSFVRTINSTRNTDGFNLIARFQQTC
mgnify:CR=1 FL=1